MKMQKLRPEYQKELEDMRLRMLEAQSFAEKMPVFAEKILQEKFHSGFAGKISDTYKGMYFGWGINRYHYPSRERILNYNGDDFEPTYLWNIYINQLSLFDRYTDTGLYEIKNKVPVFFFDPHNTTFYATDDQVVALLDALVEWYEPVKALDDAWRKEEKKNQLLRELEKLA